MQAFLGRRAEIVFDLFFSSENLILHHSGHRASRPACLDSDTRFMMIFLDSPFETY